MSVLTTKFLEIEMEITMNISELIDKRIAELDNWRGQLFVRLRNLILEVDPGLTEEWKWNNLAWSKNGLVLGMVVETTKAKEWVQLTFFQGASLEDPHHLFNAGLESKAMRYIKFREGDVIDESALRALILAAVIYNTASN
jgi:hypothetical protein